MHFKTRMSLFCTATTAATSLAVASLQPAAAVEQPSNTIVSTIMLPTKATVTKTFTVSSTKGTARADYSSNSITVQPGDTISVKIHSQGGYTEFSELTEFVPSVGRLHTESITFKEGDSGPHPLKVAGWNATSQADRVTFRTNDGKPKAITLDTTLEYTYTVGVRATGDPSTRFQLSSSDSNTVFTSASGPKIHVKKTLPSWLSGAFPGAIFDSLTNLLSPVLRALNIL
ncbi:hypothetical protein CpMEX2_00665 [Corynebacterium pseudotuberculosis]|uniref:hypothetical protein n=1 Tax=Corynebacterium pseudotuberculosis TaxID=1719 RepID=UPI0007DB5039|nr:hypothetical protein [Corynebacterium pseudotuberculosis]ANH24962.1 Hypothetical protein CpMEX9_0136 [Corynebacterium pseudotuberculosis]APZ30916.1 Hypothetical protein CpMEX1_0137 [Corynebacterium pseudotuberculosis]QGX58313.1 hypothetical protein CpMEX2_00665 [Corynebacterium pseudotuberculosis]